MFKIHLAENGQMQLPQQVMDWIGVGPGDDLTIKIIDGKLVLKQWESGAGILAHYAKAKGRTIKPETTEERRARIADYLEELNAPKREPSRAP